MPEAENNEAVVKSKRTPRKRVAKTTASKIASTSRKTVARKKTTRQTSKTTQVRSDSVVSAATESVSRKAPTVFASEKNKQKQLQKQFIIIGVILFLGVGTSAVVGYSDKGQINVAQVVEDRNQRVKTGATDESDTATELVAVPVQNTNKSANGGLVGLGTGGAKPKPSTDTATSTASSTDITASSTKAVASSTNPAAESASSTEESADDSQEMDGHTTGSAESHTATSS
jgi:hypothetical protein